MKLLSITREENERPQRLYQRIVAHLQDNLLQKNSKIKHNGKTMTTKKTDILQIKQMGRLNLMHVVKYTSHLPVALSNSLLKQWLYET